MLLGGFTLRWLTSIKVNIALTFNMSESSENGNDPSHFQELHHLHDQIICLIAWLQNSSKTLHEVNELSRKFSEHEDETCEARTLNVIQLSHHIQKLLAYTDSARAMKERVASTLRLVSLRAHPQV
jgi:hypothetical protein